MTPKEKAKELIEKYLKLDIEIGGQYDGYLTMKMHDAQQCALITVDEILNIDNIKPYVLHKEIIEFYQEVKQQIELL